uniref:Uncharacterized protein n=1 Tax=Nelumbo nucifera TaxID=4432 RepID=A0A822XUK2_NELNU|nr:TPA_asm: hypothetical protein HUJ06_024886 [Nelumbo nucifera]
MDDMQSQTQVDVVIDESIINIPAHRHREIGTKRSSSPVLARFHAGYFRISLSFCGQALLWKTIAEPTGASFAPRRLLSMFPSKAFALLWRQLSLRSVDLMAPLAAICSFLSSKNLSLYGALVGFHNPRGGARREDLWPMVYKREAVLIDGGEPD